MTELKSLFANTPMRLTRARHLVFDTLRDSAEPLYIHEIVARCDQINRSSIYRTLAAFVDMGIVEIIYTGWKKRYELAEPFKQHHHHLQCVNCHELIPLDTPDLEHLIASIGKRYDYQVTTHHFELRGLCASCQKKAHSKQI